MAATYGRLTGSHGVCITTLGPGALNLTTGAAYALLGGMPMIMLTGQKGIMSSRQAKFQIVDVVGTFQAADKAFTQIVSTSSIPTIVRERPISHRHGRAARTRPAGSLPEDVAGEEAEDIAMVPQHPIEIRCASCLADRAAEMILKAKRPLIMLGAAASRPRARRGLEVSSAVRKFQFFTTQIGQGNKSPAEASYIWERPRCRASATTFTRQLDRARSDTLPSVTIRIEKPPFIMGPKARK